MTTVASGPVGRSSSSARSGVIPMPAPISTAFSRVRTPACNRPYGPSTSTRVPGRSAASRALPSPTLSTVRRSEWPSGAADNEYGWARDQPAPSRKRHWKNCPARTGIRCRSRPVSTTDVTVGDSTTTCETTSRCRSERASGAMTRNPTTATSAAA